MDIRDLGAEIKTTMAGKREGFYTGAGAAVVSIVGVIIYAAAYSGTDYYSGWAVGLPIIGAVLFVALSLFSVSTPFAPAALLVCTFSGFLLLINAVYMIFSEVFFGGVTQEALSSMDPSFVASIVMYLIAAIAANVSLYLKQNKKQAVSQND